MIIVETSPSLWSARRSIGMVAVGKTPVFTRATIFYESRPMRIPFVSKISFASDRLCS